MLENNLTKDETLGNYERQYWNLHQSHGRPWDPLSEQVLIVKAFKTIIVALSSTQWCHSFFGLGQISLLLFIQLVATVLVIWERCLSFVQAVCAFANSAVGQVGWAPMGGCLCGSFSRVSSIWVRGLLSWWRVRHISSLSATKDALPQYSLNIVGSQQDHLLLQCNGSKVQMSE